MNQDKLLKILVAIAAVLLLVCAISTVVWFAVRPANPQAPQTTDTDTDTDTQALPESEAESKNPNQEPPVVSASVILSETPDRGQAYQDSICFLGESTTAHLRSRGVLTGGSSSPQVWVGPNNTLSLDLSITNRKISYVGSNGELTIAEAAAQVKPKYLILCFGLNNIKTFLSGTTGKELFFASYQKLIDEIRTASPETIIILQGAYPIEEHAEQRNSYPYSDSAEVIKGYLETIRTWTKEIAQKNNLRYLDAEKAVMGDNGYLLPEYSNDGIHLTAEGYRQILSYIRTHAYPEG